MTSGCSPYGSIKTGLFSEESIPSMIGQGIGGIYEGVTESVTDLGTEYDNKQLVDMLGGGTGSGVAQKACMAALGYDWDLSMDSLLNVAFTETTNTDVMGLAPKKERLFINPATGKPVYEYRGAVYVMAGCDISAVNVDLVCITRNEYDKKKGANCGVGTIGTTNTNLISANYKCNCLDATTQPNNFIGALASGAVKSNGILDKSFHKTIDDRNYVYDHMKVSLTWDKNKFKNCMPDDHKDGVWYFPRLVAIPNG